MVGWILVLLCLWLTLSFWQTSYLFNIRRAAKLSLPCGYEEDQDRDWQQKAWYINSKWLLFFFWPFYLLQWYAEEDATKRSLKIAKARIATKKQLIETLEDETEIDRLLADKSEAWLDAS